MIKSIPAMRRNAGTLIRRSSIARSLSEYQCYIKSIHSMLSSGKG
jgi:hypothetical protein